MLLVYPKCSYRPCWILSSFLVRSHCIDPNRELRTSYFFVWTLRNHHVYHHSQNAGEKSQGFLKKNTRKSPEILPLQLAAIALGEDGDRLDGDVELSDGGDALTCGDRWTIFWSGWPWVGWWWLDSNYNPWWYPWYPWKKCGLTMVYGRYNCS